MDDAETKLDGFIDRYTPQVAAEARVALARVRDLLPGAVEMVYDNYNGLAVGFGPGEKASEAVLSIVLYPRWVTLCLLRGAALADPHGLLKGKGSTVRHIRLTTAQVLNDPRALALIEEALAREKRPIDPTVPGRIVIKSISARQRPRRP